jgi:hypothetical protein
MGQLRKEMSQCRAEMRGALSALQGSIRAVDAVSFNVLGNVQIGAAATQKERAMQPLTTSSPRRQS